MNKWLLILIVVGMSLWAVVGLSMYFVGPRYDRLDIGAFRLIECITWVVVYSLTIYCVRCEKRSTVELTSESFRFVNHKGIARREIALKDVSKLSYHKALLGDQLWTVKAKDGTEMCFDQKLGRNVELARALEQRTGLKFANFENRRLAKS